MREPQRVDKNDDSPKIAEPLEESPLGKRATVPDQSPSADERGDPYAEIDDALSEWSSRERAFVEAEAAAKAEREKFIRDFEDISRTLIRPTMEAVIERLRRDGGDGTIDERRSDAFHTPRVILWMSLEGEIATKPRQDRNPFLQLDADVAHRQVDVWEGDMWERQGISQATSPWKLDEISPASVTERIVGILQRAAQHGLGA
jgi:hypothetical protein